MKINFVRRLIELRDSVEMKHLAEFVDKDAEQLARLFLGNLRGKHASGSQYFRYPVVSWMWEGMPRIHER